MTEEEIPQWALEEAMKRLNEEIGWSCYKIVSSPTKVLARMIAKHEKPPVDPDEEVLRRILKAGDAYILGAENWQSAVAQYKKEIGRDC